MLKGLMGQMLGGNQNKPNNQNGGIDINEFMSTVKGKSPEQLEGMARMLMQQNGGLDPAKVQQFEQIAKMFGATQSQIDSFKKKL